MSVIALLDACVLYPAPIRDLLLNFAEVDLFKPKWTQEIHEEWTTNLLVNRPDLDPERIQRTNQLMDNAFPDALVDGYLYSIPGVDLPDPNDIHVLQAAYTGEANFLVTSNLKDFPSETCLRYKIIPIHPDEFCLMLIESSMDVAFLSFKQLVNRLKKPPQQIEQVFETLEKCGLNKTVECLQWLNQRENLQH